MGRVGLVVEFGWIDWWYCYGVGGWFVVREFGLYGIVNWIELFVFYDGNGYMVIDLACILLMLVEVIELWCGSVVVWECFGDDVYYYVFNFVE